GAAHRPRGTAERARAGQGGVGADGAGRFHGDEPGRSGRKTRRVNSRPQFVVARPASLITFDHFTISLATRPVNSSGVLPIGSAPSCDMRWRTSGTLTMRTSSPLILPTMSLRVPAGANTPCHELIS